MITVHSIQHTAQSIQRRRRRRRRRRRKRRREGGREGGGGRGGREGGREAGNAFCPPPPQYFTALTFRLCVVGALAAGVVVNYWRGFICCLLRL